jgi:hypothetical protein
MTVGQSQRLDFAFLSEGSCNHVPTIDAMREAVNPRYAKVREAREAVDAAHAALSRAREQLRQAQENVR